MVMVYFDGLFAKDQYQFTFTFSASPALKLSFDRPVLVPPPPSRPFKRRRALSDVDGGGNAGRKKRRLRLHLITSRLSRPFSQPATNIANRGVSKIALWQKNRVNKNLLRKAAIMNRMRMRLDATRKQMLQEQDKDRHTLPLCELPPPTPRPLEPLPPSPLGLSNYDALDLEDEPCCCDWGNDDGENDGERNQDAVDDGGPNKVSDIYSDFNIMNPTTELGEGYEYLDALDGLSPYGFPDMPPSPPPEEAVIEILKEKEREGDSYFVKLMGHRSCAIKSRIIPLTPEFLSYLREDGIVLPSETTPTQHGTYNDTSTSTDWDSEPQPEPQDAFPEIHQKITDAIAELGGLVAPKLNWSAPKDATWISIKKNSMECATPSDIYLLLKSSDFITHDLEHAFDDTAEGPLTKDDIQYVLVLRKWFKVNPSCEFRCFVRDRRIIGICQRDLNHFDFLFPFIPTHISTIQSFFTSTLKDTFPESNFVFDIYLPEPYNKVRLMDINPWAPRTDPLLFSWLELLTMSVPRPLLGIPDSSPPEKLPHSSDEDTEDSESHEFIEEEIWTPELRLIKRDDPEAYSFATPQYSAHKLPKDVVDASLSGETGMRDFATQWQKMINGELEMGNINDDSGSSDEEEVSVTPR
ncbi:hypothetical protein B7463_g2594, partial [Scytalidium lignicola]